MPEPLARDEDRAADVEAEGVVLERRPVPVAHQEPDQPRVGVVDLFAAAGEADACGVDDGEVVGHRRVETDEAVVEDGNRGVGYHFGGDCHGFSRVLRSPDGNGFRLDRHVGLVVSRPGDLTSIPPARERGLPRLLLRAVPDPSSSTRPATGFRPRSSSARWAAAVPDGFRFAVKASPQALRSFGTFEERVRMLGDRLGPVRVVVESPRDDGLLALLLGSTDLRLALDLRDESWAGVDVAPAVRVNDHDADGPFRYLRFREPPYSEEQLVELAATIEPLLACGTRGLRVLPARGRADCPGLRRAAARARPPARPVITYASGLHAQTGIAARL